jgi:hypothetical protein
MKIRRIDFENRAIEWWYDHRSWFAVLKDQNNNQIGSSVFSHDFAGLAEIVWQEWEVNITNFH